MRTIAFLVTPTFQLMDLAGPLCVFTEAQHLGLKISIEFYSYTSVAQCCAGIAFENLKLFMYSDLKKGDYIFLPAIRYKQLMEDTPDEYNRFTRWILECSSKGVVICASGNAAFILAEIGLLDDKKATTHWRASDEMQKRYPKVKVLGNSLFVRDGNIITSAGIAAAIDTALDIVENIKGPAFASSIARDMIIYQRRSHNHSQQSVYLDYRNHLNPRIHKLQDYVSENLHIENSLEKLADLFSMSSRNMTRLFKKSTGTTVNEYITSLRIENAKTLQNNPDYTLELIASKCGFRSVRQLQRILTRSIEAS
jgi:transcriptional regulator GlxA family with amidase domain